MSESSELTFEDFYRYLALWEDAYPGGIPEAASRTGDVVSKSSRDAESSSAAPRAIFLANAAEVGSAEKQIFQAAVSKGLQWREEDCLLCPLNSIEDEGFHKVEQLVDRRSCPVVLLGGLPEEITKEIEAVTDGRTSIIRSVSLQQVVSDKASKRRFWEDLKTLQAIV